MVINNKNFRQSFLQNNHILNEEPIKVQLVKNNNNKRIYSTKTIDIKTLYNNQMLVNSKNIDNDDIPNFNSNKRKMLSNDTDKQKYKITTESNDYIYANNINPDKSNKYNGIGSQYKYSSINSPRIISAFPSKNIQYIEDKNNYKIDNTQPRHQIRDLLSKKFLYNKPKTTSTPKRLMSSSKPGTR